MKKGLFLSIFLFSTSGFAQEVNETSKEIQMEIRVEDENGMQTVEIRTIEDGKERIEIYQGEAAEKKLEEIQSQLGEDREQIKKEVILEETDGLKKLTIRTENSEGTTEEVYLGEDVDKKMKELELENTAPKIEIKKMERIERE